jgi:hypothetical protein
MHHKRWSGGFRLRIEDSLAAHPAAQLYNLLTFILIFKGGRECQAFDVMCK